MYVTVDDVYSLAGITTAEVSPDIVRSQILQGMKETDRITHTTYFEVLGKSTATSGTNNTIVGVLTPLANDKEYTNYAVYIYSGTGLGEMREITNFSVLNGITTITTDVDWTTVPDDTSKFIVTYLNRVTEVLDGTGRQNLSLSKSPVIQLNSLVIDTISVNPENVYLYDDSGQLILSENAVQSFFTFGNKKIQVDYFYGMLPELQYGQLDIPIEVKTLCSLITAVAALITQIGGTFDALSTFSVPNLSGSIGQAYINIKATVDSLLARIDTYKKEIIGQYMYIG